MPGTAARLQREDELSPMELWDVETQDYLNVTQKVRQSFNLMQSSFLRMKYAKHNIEMELQRMSLLRKDWDSYGAEPPSSAAIDAARGIIAQMADSLIFPSVIVPSATGGVSVYRFNHPRTVYIENYNDGRQALVMYDQDGNTDVLEIGDDIQASEVPSRISRFLG